MPKRVPTFRPPWLARPRERRANSAGRGYGSAAWQRVRLAVIARDKGVCRDCGKVIYEPGDAHVDHVEEKPTNQAAEATPIEGLQLLCRSCHSKKTVRSTS